MSTQFLHKIRSTLFSPESRLELFVRTLYHRAAASKAFFWVQEKMVQTSYRRWKTLQKKQIPPVTHTSSRQPLISFLIDYSQESPTQLQQTLDSILAQNTENWEILIIAPESHRNVDAEPDPRIKTVDQPANLLDGISGEYLVFCKSGDVFSTSLLGKFYEVIAEGEEPDLIYYDCEIKQGNLGSRKPLFKPAVYAPELMISVNYLSRAVIKVDAVRSTTRDIASHVDLPSQEYSILTNLCENNGKYRHLPYQLLFQKDWSLPLNHEPSMDVLKDRFQHLGIHDLTTIEHEHSTQLQWPAPRVPVSIIILTKNHYRMLKALLTSIQSQDYDQEYEIILVDNASNDEKVLNYYRELEKESELHIINYAKPFNYSEAINLGVHHSNHELILLLNDDMQVASPGWLSELSRWAMLPEIGVVGAKLIRKNHVIQHMGIIMGLVGFVGHIYLNAPEHYHGLWGSSDWYRNVIAITGACQMMRREVFDRVGGYNPDYRIAFGDIDFCRRIFELGFRNMVTPFARLYHYEGQTRGYLTPVDDTLKGYQEFTPYLLEDDPYYSPNLTYTRIPKCVREARSYSERSAQIEARKQFYLNNPDI